MQNYNKKSNNNHNIRNEGTKATANSSNNPNKHKQTTSFIELRKLKTEQLLFKLKQNKDNIKGIGEYLRKFGFKKDENCDKTTDESNDKNSYDDSSDKRDKNNNLGLTAKDIVKMLIPINNNIHAILSEVERRLKKKIN